MHIEEVLKQLVGLAGTVIGTGTVLTFVLQLLKRRDEASHRREDSCRVYEIGFRKADAWGRQLATLAGPVALAHHEGREEMADQLWELLASFLADQTGESWRLRPHPDFLAEAREELNTTEGRRSSDGL